MPYEAALGTQNITVRTSDTGELIAGSSVVVESVSPSLFSGTSAPYAIQNFDGTINSATNPALRGSTINIFGTGQGPVSPIDRGRRTRAVQREHHRRAHHGWSHLPQ